MQNQNEGDGQDALKEHSDDRNNFVRVKGRFGYRRTGIDPFGQLISLFGSKHFAFTFRRHGVVGILDALKQGALSRVPFIDSAENSIEPSCIIVFE